jgi:hypothetical protein
MTQTIGGQRASGADDEMRIEQQSSLREAGSDRFPGSR